MDVCCVRRFLRKTTDGATDAKPCGPGIPVLMPSLRRCFRIALMTGARKPVPGESSE
jgi:hypothetical protein